MLDVVVLGPDCADALVGLSGGDERLGFLPLGQLTGFGVGSALEGLIFLGGALVLEYAVLGFLVAGAELGFDPVAGSNTAFIFFAWDDGGFMIW